MAQATAKYPHKSSRELRASLVLFTLLSSPSIVRLGLMFWKFLQFIRFPVSPLVRFTGYYQFCAGKDVVASAAVTSRMRQHNVYSVLDYTHEHALNEQDFDHNLAVVLQTISEAQRSKSYPFVVVKPTALGAFRLFEKKSNGGAFSSEEQHGWDKTRKRFEQLAKETEKAGIVLMIDAEESWIQPGIDALVLPLLPTFNQKRVVVAITFQLYLKNQIENYKKLIIDATSNNYFLGVKWVRGAYMEKERDRAERLGITNPVCDTKDQTDLQYRQAVELALKHIDTQLCIVATHNESDILWVMDTCATFKISINNSNLWFSQLYGMRDYITFDLAAKGANVFKYVPFGPLSKSIPYLIRRALENSAVKSQTAREKVMIKAELKQRRASV